MRIVFLGSPGSGKGTQAKLLSTARAVPHLSTGDMLRGAIARGTPTGLKAKEFVETGKLVPDEIVDALVVERLKEDDAQAGFLLDGYPRTPAQADALGAVLTQRGEALTAVINVHVDDDVLVRRIGGRRGCPGCGAIYHMEAKPPAREGVCDACGGALQQREDDTEDVVRHRLRVYHLNTAPLVEHYDRQGLLHRIDGDQPIGDVQRAIQAAVGEAA